MISTGSTPARAPPREQPGDIARLLRSGDRESLELGLARVRLALERSPLNHGLLLARAQCLLALGRLREARDAAAEAQRNAPSNSLYWDAVATAFSRAGEQWRAMEAYQRALQLAPNDPRILFNRAAVRRFVGELELAESDYDSVIHLEPKDYEAYKNRSDLRVQTEARNHTAELEALLQREHLPWPGEVQLRYALAKEYEDLGRYASAFEHLARGSRLRRQHLRYDVGIDEQTVAWIIEAFPASPSFAPAKTRASTSDAQPIFIVGMPRSGSTLVDRILDSHPQVTSAGELPCFAQAMTDAVRRRCRVPAGRRELVSNSAALEFAALGHEYLTRARSAGAEGERFTDKMPLNYLYCGLIRRALPRARIVHVTRSPMAACYAMYKTLFDGGYPFSYDQTELGRYYSAYRRLMAHWRSTLPDAIHELRYEDLIADQEGESRRLLEFCGLEWHEDCLAFHRNPSPATTASAAQIRQPLYASSVEQWRHYERQLRPLSAAVGGGEAEVRRS